MQQVGGSFGTAIFAMILQTQLSGHHVITLAGRAGAFDTAFWWSIGLTALVLIPVFAIPAKGKSSARSDQKAGTAA
jgi:hypothetical protein